MDDREDLGAQFARVARRLADAERPLLEAHGLTMWQYVVLSRLRVAPASTQQQLAEAIGYDKTRLIALLETLDGAGLIARPRDEHDRRRRVVELTAAGRRRVEAARRDIHAMEDHLLDGVASSHRAALRRALAHLDTGDADGP